MSSQILPPTTAGIDPEKFSGGLYFAKGGTLIFLLGLFLFLGFLLRANDLGVESLGEDEFNKLQTVEEYRSHGLSGKNGEHPFLMKGLQTVSISAVENLNNRFFSAQNQISEEAALRFPIALFGTFSIILIFLLVSELFGPSIGLVSAALLAVEPMAVGFDRIGKEDSLVLFFFLLCSLFLVKSQTAAGRGNANWIRYIWGAAASFGALMASKYYPFYFSIIAGYYNVFLNVPGNKWNIGNLRWLKFFIVMGIVFLILNPTIVLPETWHEMLKFSSESRVGHDSYEFMGRLYPHRVTDWLAGVPWTFYYVFIGVKTSVPTLVLFVIGLPVIFKRRLGDGRFFVLLWAFLWFMPFTVLGGKFTRYFAFAEPLILIVAAVGFSFAVKWLSERLFASSPLAAAFQSILLAAFIAAPLLNSLAVAPYFRMFTNSIGGGMAAAGTYFPHDEVYDSSTKEIIEDIAVSAPADASVACETPDLFEYYAGKAGRSDLKFVSLSDKVKVADLKASDLIVIDRGRRYFSNAGYVDFLENSAEPLTYVNILGVTSAIIYQLDESSLAGVQAIATQ